MTNKPLPHMEEYLHTAKHAAHKAGAVLKKYWGKLSAVREKTNPWDLVTEADKESEEVIAALLKKKCPSHAIIGEESGLLTQVPDSEFIWYIDPLDGTTNYTHQFPMVCISIGLVYQNEPVLGIVYNPFFEEMFQGARNAGASLNGNKITVSKVSHLSNSLLVTGFPYNRKETPKNNYAEFCHLTHIAQGVRRIGSAALDLAYVAAGRLDGYWEIGLKPWDLAAGVAILLEAGGLVSSYDLQPFDLRSGMILASNGLIHSNLSREIMKAQKDPKSFLHIE